jgi:hypothetical protein
MALDVSTAKCHTGVRNMKGRYMTLNPHTETMRRLLLEYPGITHGQLVEKTGWAPKTVTKYMEAVRAEWQAKAKE